MARYRAGDGSIHDSYEAASDQNRWNEATDIRKNLKFGGAIVALICFVGPFYYLPQLAVRALMDYGIMTTFGMMFLAISLPLIVICILSVVRFFRSGKGLAILIILAILLLPCGFLGFFKLFIGKDYLYDKYYSLQLVKFADGKYIRVNTDNTNLRINVPANSRTVTNLQNGASLMLVGANDSGQLLVRANNNERKLVWGWVDANKTDYQNNSKYTGLVPATIISDTLNLRLYQKPVGRKTTATKGKNEINVVVIGHSTNKFVGPKLKNGYVPVYAWNNNTNFRYTGYAPIACLFLHEDGAGRPPSSPTAPEGIKRPISENWFMYDRPHFEPGNYRDMQDGTAFMLNDFASKTLKPGDNVIVVGDANKDSWLPVWFDGEYGWLHPTVNVGKNR